ncbi:MAG: hypothetical protein ACT4P2_09320 [Pseudomonadota bacterium]
MPERRVVDLFAEDHAHEAFLRPLIGRIASDFGTAIKINVRSARGGHPRALGELDVFLESVATGGIGMPDMLVVAIDTNCARPVSARNRIMTRIVPALRGTTVAACPDPHIERWFLADPGSFGAVVGCFPRIAKRKCVRDYYKEALVRGVRGGGNPSTLGGLEFAEELVQHMDLHRAGRNVPSLGHFIDDLKVSLRTLGGA